MKRHLLSGLVAVAALSLALTGCAGTDKSEDPGADPTDSKTTYTIGIATYVSHPALQAVQDGFEEVLKEEGISYTVVSQNGLGDPANSATIANAFAADQSLDLILAITTPIALAMATAEQDRPILFSAVTDPVEVGLVPSWDQAGFNVTGTSDLNPDARPVALVKEAMPDVKTIGVLYSSSEANSLIQLRAYEAEAAELGLTIKAQAITSQSEISVGLEALAGVDAILIPTDNTVVAQIATVIGYGQENQIPVFCADTSTVSLGTVATRGLSYHDLGRRTGEMAVSILRDGVDISTIPAEATTSTELLFSTEAAAAFGLTLPPALIAKGADVSATQ